MRIPRVAENVGYFCQVHRIPTISAYKYAPFVGIVNHGFCNLVSGLLAGAGCEPSNGKRVFWG